MSSSWSSWRATSSMVSSVIIVYKSTAQRPFGDSVFAWKGNDKAQS